MVAVKKTKPPKDGGADALVSDVAAFASTLGFSSSAAPASGFNDADFRKTGSFKSTSKPAAEKEKPPPPKNSATKNAKPNTKPNAKGKQFPKPAQRPTQKPAQNQRREFGSSNLVPEVHDDSKFKNLPKLPLVKSSALGSWHSDAAELEETLIGKDKKIEFKSVEEWKALVEKKKELGERLVAQYAQEYMSSRGQHGEIKMVLATQRSGTAADKVSALTVLIGDNAVANLRAVDSLLGTVLFELILVAVLAVLLCLGSIFKLTL